MPNKQTNLQTFFFLESVPKYFTKVMPTLFKCLNALPLCEKKVWASEREGEKALWNTVSLETQAHESTVQQRFRIQKSCSKSQETCNK